MVGVARAHADLVHRHRQRLRRNLRHDGVRTLPDVVAGGKQDKRAVLVHANDDGRGDIRRHRRRFPAARNALTAEFRRAAAGRTGFIHLHELGGALEALLITRDVDGLSRCALAAFADAVELAHFERVDPHLVRDHVDVLLDAKVDFAHAKSAIRPADGVVCVDAVAVGRDVLDVIRANAAPARGFDDVDAVFRIRAAVPGEHVFGAYDLAVLAHGGLDVDVQTLAHIGVLELVLARVGHLDRATGVEHRERDDDAFQRRARLAAESAADGLADHANLVEREVERLRQRAAHGKRALARGPDGQVAVRHILRGAGVRLDRHMLHVRNVEIVVEHAIRLFKRLVRVAFSQHVVMRDVGSGLRIKDRQHLIGAEVGVDDRSIRLHALQRVRDGGQHFVFHLHELASAARNLRRVRRDSRDRLAAIARFADRDEVSILQIQTRALSITLSRDYAAHAGQ